MKQNFTVRISLDVSRSVDPRGFVLYGFLSAVATSEEEARALIEQHLAEGRPLGFSERELRKRNPRRTPWRPGLKVLYFLFSSPVPDDRPIGVESDDDADRDDIPF
ncbi:MAG: hypothetical protein U0797_08230 [Gemmataceae bacterium]